MPCRRSFHAQADPAGPPPAISTSHLSTTIDLASTADAGEWDGGSTAAREQNLKQLKRAGPERRL
jgi:hypothetical protein